MKHKQRYRFQGRQCPNSLIRALATVFVTAMCCLFFREGWFALAIASLSYILLWIAELLWVRYKHGYFSLVANVSSVDCTFEIVDFFHPSKPADNYRELQICGMPGAYSRISLAPMGKTIYFYDYCRLVLEAFLQHGCCVQKALTLGGAGCAEPLYLAEHYPDMSIDIVEIDETLIEIASQYFLLGKIREKIRFYAMDAENYLRKYRGQLQYGLIFCDLFCHDQPSATIFKPTFAQNLYVALQENGILIINIGEPASIDTRPLNRLYRSYFDYCTLLFHNGSLVLLAEKCGAQPSVLQKIVESQQDFPLQKYIIASL